MAVSIVDLQTEGFGTLFGETTSGGTDPNIELVSVGTTNAVSVQLFQKTLDPSVCATFRATIVVIRNSTAAIVGKFVREFTVKRVGAAPAILLQDLVPSPDFQEDLGLAATPGTDANNAVIMITGMAAALTWHGRIEAVS